jgi:hypothetical protein
MEDAERDTLAFDQVRDDEPDAGALPGVEGQVPAGDDGVTRRTVRLEGRASRVGWYVAGGGLLGALGLVLIVIALSRGSSSPATPPVRSHQRVVVLPARRSPHRPHHHARPDRKPKGQRRLSVVSRRRVIRRQVVVPVAPASSPVPVVAEPRSPAPVVVPVPAEEPRASQHRGGVGQFGYLGR